jgi:TonB-dependent starch-binding outer membrane protein SusC
MRKYLLTTLLGMLLTAAMAQEVSVSGKVVTAEGTALPGVNVLVKGTTEGTTTDADGSYKLSVQPGATLSFSFIGYATEEIVVGNQTTINITMKEDLQTLSEVVVIGYGTESKRNLSTSIASVDSKALARQPVASFEQSLQGQAAGVQVTSPSGAPGAGINIRIRGNNSATLGNSPLYVIDGVPIVPRNDDQIPIGNQRYNPLTALNPNDIESIDVLKDGAAAAIYGSRAANGVVVITTKRGKSGKAQIGLNVYHGTQQLRKKIELLNGREFADYYNEITKDTRAASGLGLVYPNLDADSVNINTDWQDLIYRTAPISNYQLTASGGTDKSRYYIAGSYFNQDGIVINSGFKRLGFKINFDQEISKRIRVGTSLNLSRGDRNGSVRSEAALGNGGTIAGALSQIPTLAPYQADGRYSLNPFIPTDNPLGAALETRNRAISYQVIGSAFAEVDIVKNLTFRTSVGLDFRQQTENEYVTRKLPATQNAPSDTRGSARTGSSVEPIWLWENSLSYKTLLAGRHEFTFLIGNSYQESNRLTSGASGNGFATDFVPYVLGATQNISGFNYEDEWGLSSYYARVIYNLEGKYLATASMRADQSSRFAKDLRTGYFPALSFAWRVSQESFFPKSDIVNDVKIRLSWAASGNQGLGAYDRFTQYALGHNYPGAGGSLISGVGPDRLGNGKVKWETTYQYNGGLDVALLANKITLSADFYQKNTVDLLTQVNLPISSGFNQPIIQNLGEIQNKGIEIGINTNNIQSANGFTWNTQFNYSLNRNEVIDIGKEVNTQGVLADRIVINGDNVLQKGVPLGAFYGYVPLDIFQNQFEVNQSPIQDNARPGDIRFLDISGPDGTPDGIINDLDRRVIGNPNPDFFAGITNTLSYGGIELSFLFQGSFGNEIYNQNRLQNERMAGPENGNRNVLNRWKVEGQNTIMPRAVLGDPNNNARFSTRFLEDGSYVRLKNITLAYNVPTSLLSRLNIASARIYVTGQNLLTFTDYTGYDPEVGADPNSTIGIGRDLGVYPQSKIYTVGVNLQF